MLNERFLGCFKNHATIPLLKIGNLTLRIIEGFELCEQISKVKTTNDNPDEPIKMTSIEISLVGGHGLNGYLA